MYNNQTGTINGSRVRVILISSVRDQMSFIAEYLSVGKEAKRNTTFRVATTLSDWFSQMSNFTCTERSNTLIARRTRECVWARGHRELVKRVPNLYRPNLENSAYRGMDNVGFYTVVGGLLS